MLIFAFLQAVSNRMRNGVEEERPYRRFCLNDQQIAQGTDLKMFLTGRPA